MATGPFGRSLFGGRVFRGSPFNKPVPEKNRRDQEESKRRPDETPWPPALKRGEQEEARAKFIYGACQEFKLGQLTVFGERTVTSETFEQVKDRCPCDRKLDKWMEQLYGISVEGSR